MKKIFQNKNFYLNIPYFLAVLVLVLPVIIVTITSNPLTADVSNILICVSLTLIILGKVLSIIIKMINGMKITLTDYLLTSIFFLLLLLLIIL